MENQLDPPTGPPVGFPVTWVPIAPVLPPRETKRSRTLGVAALVALVAALLAVVAPSVEIAHISSQPEVVLGDGPRQVTLPADTNYGVFFNDPYNTGYSESCNITDSGRPVALSDPGSFMTSSDTENLDYVFNTGSGHLVVDCESTAERVSLQPLPNLMVIVIGIGLTILLGIAALVLAILWLARVGARPR